MSNEIKEDGSVDNNLEQPAEGTIDSKTLEQMREVLRSFMPTIIEALLSSDSLDRGKLADKQYVWTIVKNNFNSGESVSNFIAPIWTLEEDFIAFAKDAVSANKLTVAIVLIATAIESTLNTFYRMILSRRGMSEEAITEAIKSSSTRAKLTWLMSLVSTQEIKLELSNRIIHLMDVRNAIVHFKAIPTDLEGNKMGSKESIEQHIRNLDFDKLLSLPSELFLETEKILENSCSDYKLAKEITETMFS